MEVDAEQWKVKLGSSTVTKLSQLICDDGFHKENFCRVLSENRNTFNCDTDDWFESVMSEWYKVELSELSQFQARNKLYTALHNSGHLTHLAQLMYVEICDGRSIENKLLKECKKLEFKKEKLEILLWIFQTQFVFDDIILI